MTTALTTIAPKLGKLIPLLASDKPAEVVATAAAISRTLKQAGADWHDLTAVVIRAAPPAARAKQRGAVDPVAEPLAWRDIPEGVQARWLSRMSASRLLSAWEQNFCASILAQVRYRPWSMLSAKQSTVLDRCIGKFIAEARRRR